VLLCVGERTRWALPRLIVDLDDTGDVFLKALGHRNYTALQPRKWEHSYLLLRYPRIIMEAFWPNDKYPRGFSVCRLTIPTEGPSLVSEF
jgi:hypothetical protein